MFPLQACARLQPWMLSQQQQLVYKLGVLLVFFSLL